LQASTFAELIQDERKKHRKAPAWSWFLIILVDSSIPTVDEAKVRPFSQI
jgi:hypothetical protein